MKSEDIYVIGVDYGTDSVRALLINASNGQEVAVSVFEYPRWKKGLFCNPSQNQFRQHPLDYIEGFKFVIKEVLKNNAHISNSVKAISIDTTGSTPVAVNKSGIPLALFPEFENNPNAMFILWKDHTAIDEAIEINQHCKNWGGTDFTKYSGGVYSSEWYWSKVLHIIKTDALVSSSAHS